MQQLDQLTRLESNAHYDNFCCSSLLGGIALTGNCPVVFGKKTFSLTVTNHFGLVLSLCSCLTFISATRFFHNLSKTAFHKPWEIISFKAELYFLTLLLCLESCQEVVLHLEQRWLVSPQQVFLVKHFSSRQFQMVSTGSLVTYSLVCFILLFVVFL